MTNLKLYLKPFKKYFDVISIDFESKMIIFDSNQVEEILVGKKISDCWCLDNWNKFKKLTEDLLTSRQSTAGISFKKEFIVFPKQLKHLEKFLK